MAYEQFYQSKLGNLRGSGAQRTINCPFCGHKNDFSINIQSGQCKCFQCGFEGDPFSFLMKLKNLTFLEAKKELAKYEIKPISSKKIFYKDYESKDKKIIEKKAESKIDYQEMEVKAEEYGKNLDGDLRIFLRESRGLSDETLDRYRLGCVKTHPEFGGGERLTIPILKDGKVVNIRFHSLRDEKPKDYPYSKDLPYATWLFPEDQLKNDKIWLSEGELDALCAISHGLNAITVTGGAGIWREEFTPLFKGKKVNIVYDCDKAGRKGAETVAEKLCNVTQVKVIDLGLGDGEDLTDWFVNYGKSKEELEKLAKRTPIFEKLTKAEQEIRDNALELASQSLTVKELLETKLPEEEFLIGNGLMPKGGYILLAGATKEGKTILALQMGLHLISATPFLKQFPIKEKRRVLYLYAENTLNGLNSILDKQITGLQQNFKISNDDPDNLILQGARGLFLDKIRGIRLLDELIKIHKPGVVFIDPLSLFTSQDINKLENVTKMITHLNRISTVRDCSWIIIHHYRKPSKENTEPIYKVMGSSGFGNYCDTFMGLERSHKQRTSNFKTLHFLLRREETPEPTHLYRDPETLLYEPISKEEVITKGVRAENIVRILKEELKGKASYSLIIDLAKDELGVTKQRISELLREAKDKGLVAKEKGKFGKWYVL